MEHYGKASSPQNNNNSNRKKASSFTGFLGKFLPTHRPEQGGTLRSLDNKSTESAYRDVGINPEALNHWNIPEDLPISRRLEIEEGRASNSSLRPEPTRPKIRPGPRRPPTPSQRPSSHLSAAETQHLLRRKQRSQRKHRELKASGDWLGVTGANPHTGQYNVLTPTESVSSEVTPPSTKIEMSKLTKTVRQAERNYEKAKQMEGAAKEKHRMEKAQLKLDKIEKAKAVIQQQHGSLEWKKHGREWSSVREPGLSPIAQSFTNTEVSENHSEEDISENESVISREESKGKQPVRVPPLSSPRRHEGGNKLRKRRQNAEPSADTIIHTPSRQPSGVLSSPSQGHDDSGTKADGQVSNTLRARKHFLWGRRRRATDPGRGEARHKPSYSDLIVDDPSEREIPLSQHNVSAGSFRWIGNPRLSPRSRNAPNGADRTGGAARSEQWPIAVATAISSQSTLREPTKSPFAAPQRLDRSQSAIDLTENARGPQHHPVLRPGEDGMRPRPTNSQKSAVEMVAPGALENMAQPRTVDTPAEKDAADHLKHCNQEVSCQGKETARKAKIESDKVKEETNKAVSFPDKMPQETERERTPRLSRRSSDSELEQHDISKLKQHVTSTIHQVSKQSRGSHDSFPLQYNAERLAETRIQPLGSHFRYCIGQDCGYTPAKVSRRNTVSTSPRNLEKQERREQNSPRSPPAPKRQVGEAHPNEKYREATVQGAARTAMVQSQGKASNLKIAPSKGISKKKNKDKSPNEKENGEGGKKERKDESPEKKEKAEGEAEDGSSPKVRKSDAMITLQRITLALSSWVWATLHYWWDVMHPVFDAESELWKRRHREESTWADVGVFLFAGVSLTVGLALGVRFFKTTQSLYQVVYYSL
ncbi:hypothetical protein PG993_003394 [Apiospora rasikravindrae]|uniref:Uncharacterized protein n=1 Tax=Apiospora rasikravindrae TaxID=990691 RepID=A0ABR1U260_9PEZI